MQSCLLKVNAQLKTFGFKQVEFKPIVFKPNAAKTVWLTTVTILKPKVAVIPKNLYVCSLKSICKLEYQFQKASKIPLYFRLGSLNYTNYLEGKNNLYLLK